MEELEEICDICKKHCPIDKGKDTKYTLVNIKIYCSDCFSKNSEFIQKNIDAYLIVGNKEFSESDEYKKLQQSYYTYINDRPSDYVSDSEDEDENESEDEN
jgi:hypothetical protein